MRRKNVETRLAAAHREIARGFAGQSAAALAASPAPKPLEDVWLDARIDARIELTSLHVLSRLQSMLCKEPRMCRHVRCRRAKHCRKQLGIAREMQALQRRIDNLSPPAETAKAKGEAG
jgi:hypothetical protein